MKLIIGGQVDDERFQNTELLARVGCGICELRGKPIHVQAVPEDNEIVSDEQLLELMAAWSREHSATHTDQEHEDHAAIRTIEPSNVDPERVKRLLGR